MLLVYERRRRGERISTVAADKGYDSRDFVDTMRAMNVRAHVTQNNNHRRCAIDVRTTRHLSYAISEKKRPLIERTFCWIKAIAGMRKVKLRGLAQCRLAVRADGGGLQSLADSQAAAVRGLAGHLEASFRRPALQALGPVQPDQTLHQRSRNAFSYVPPPLFTSS